MTEEHGALSRVYENYFKNMMFVFGVGSLTTIIGASLIGRGDEIAGWLLPFIAGGMLAFILVSLAIRWTEEDLENEASQ